MDLSEVEQRLFLSGDDFRAKVRAQGRARCHWAEELRHDDAEYKRLLLELKERRMIYFSFACKESVGLFTVEMKEGKLRLIIDCRRLNQRMKTPPRTPLASSCAFGELASSSEGLWYAGHDVANCFYNFRIPDALSLYLGMRPVRAGDVKVKMVDGVPVSPSALICPRLTVLPMGFSFALHWAQQARLNILFRAKVVDPNELIVDFRPPPPMEKGKPATIVYVDNAIFIGGDLAELGKTGCVSARFGKCRFART